MVTDVKGINVNVDCIHAAIGAASGRVGYEGDKDLASPIRCVKPGSEVVMITVDSLALPACGLIKMDLQGYDYFGLRGAVETIKEYQPTIVFEHDPPSYIRYAVAHDAPGGLLKELGYERVVPGHDQVWVAGSI